MDFSLSAKYSRSYDPSTTEIPEVSQSVEHSPDEKATPEPERNFSPSDPSLANLISDISQSPAKFAPARTTSRTTSSKKSMKRPQSAKQLVSSPLVSSRESLARVSRLTSSAAVTSLYHVISSRVRTSGHKSLKPEDLQDIKSYFENEQYRFEEILSTKVGGKALTPYEIHRREKTRQKNVEALQKHEEIADRKHQEEVDRAKQAYRLLKNSTEERLSMHIQKMIQKLERQRRLEASQAQREQAEQTASEKSLILSNIRNFYRDRIALLKEQIEAERMNEHLRVVEQRQVTAT